MSKATLEYTEKHHILEVDGVEYEIPQRTAALSKKMEEHDANMKGRSEFENNFELLCILFGKTKAKKMFSEGENCNLDKLAKCVKLAMALYLADYTEMQQEDMKQTLEKINPLLGTVKDVEKAANLAQMKNFVAKKKK